MSVLIGVIDQRIQETIRVGWDTNKVGGLPAWIESESLTFIPECKNCGQPSALVTQIYCPLGGSAYHRCIYLFVCPGICSKQQNGWRVYRTMKLDVSYQTDLVQVKKEPQPSHSFDDVWAQGQDDWSGGSDDWGNEASFDDNQQNQKMVFEPINNPVMETAETDNKGLDPALGRDVYNTDLSQSVERLSQMVLSANLDHSGCSVVDGGNSITCSVTPMPALAPNYGRGDAEESVTVEAIGLLDTERWNAMTRILNTKLDQDMPISAESKSSIVFESYYLSVVDEPVELAEGCKHVKELIRDYERSEGKQLHLLISERPNTSKGKGGPSEVYERTELSHGDKMFYKFMKRLQRCPQQGIRYDRGGDPLLVRSLPELPVSQCPHCGSKKIFEFQLLPPLIPFLKAKNDTPFEVEFGTVLVYTCERNCWPAEQSSACELNLLEESIVLQEDPDTHLYR